MDDLRAAFPPAGPVIALAPGGGWPSFKQRLTALVVAPANPASESDSARAHEQSGQLCTNLSFIG
jgi:hypothetical protein